MRFWREGKDGHKRPWAFMERFEVPSVDKPMEAHFVRYRLVQTPWFGLYVHQFDNADVRTFHDHPWDFASLVVLGGYMEATPARPDKPSVDIAPVLRELTRWSVNHKRATDLHYIARLLRKPTWTVIVTGRRKRKWGYFDEAGWTPFDEHPNAAKFDAAMAARRRLARYERHRTRVGAW